mmetsp:Transcript_17132/g.43165  ORF Transcript_17132/g.43165 Transcript_17132/m.43165 type:complete len:161 (-) Transcript_17132:91-573(-)
MGWTVLHTSALDGDMKRVRHCVEDIKWLKGIDVNAQTEQRGHSALHMCAANGHIEVMQYIINADGTNKDIQTHQGNTPLHLAAINDREKACKLLVSNGCDVRISNKGGKTADKVCPRDGPLKDFLTKEVQEALKKSRGRGGAHNQRSYSSSDNNQDEDEV